MMGRGGEGFWYEKEGEKGGGNMMGGASGA